MRWIKAPAGNEPVLPPGCTGIVAVVSARAIGEPLDERVAHRIDHVGRVAGLLQTKLVRRKVPLRNLSSGTIDAAAGGTARQEIALQQGIPIETAREIVKFVKERKLKKIQVAIQADHGPGELAVARRAAGRDGAAPPEGLRVELNFGNFRSQ